MKTKSILLVLFGTISMGLTAQTNIVPNGDMESWSSNNRADYWYGWDYTKDTNTPNGSDKSLLIELQSTTSSITNNTQTNSNTPLYLDNNKTYVISFDYKKVMGDFSEIKIELSQFDISGGIHSYFTKAFTSFSGNWDNVEFDYSDGGILNLSVTVTGNQGSQILIDNISIVDKSSLGIDTVTKENVSFGVYPNPSNDYISVKGLKGKQSFEIFDTLGRNVLTGETIGDSKINVSSLTEGVYILRVDLHSLKFVKK